MIWVLMKNWWADDISNTWSSEGNSMYTKPIKLSPNHTKQAQNYLKRKPSVQLINSITSDQRTHCELLSIMQEAEYGYFNRLCETIVTKLACM